MLSILKPSAGARRTRLFAVATIVAVSAAACSGGSSSPELAEIEESDSVIEAADDTIAHSEFCNAWEQAGSALNQLDAAGSSDRTGALTEIRVSLDALVSEAPSELVTDADLFGSVTLRLTEALEESGFMLENVAADDERALAAKEPEFLSAVTKLGAACASNIDMAAIGGPGGVGFDLGDPPVAVGDTAFETTLMNTYGVDAGTASCLADELDAMDSGQLDTERFVDPTAEICGMPLSELIGLGA